MTLTRNALAPFLLISLAFHLLFLVRWPARAPRERVPEEIPVTVLPAPIREAPPSPASAKEVPEKPAAPRTEPAKSAPQSAKAVTPATETPRSQLSAPVAPEERPGRAELANARVIETEPAPGRPLPKLKDILPNAIGLAIGDMSGRREAPIPLNSRDPKYVSYFTLLQQVIDLEWQYPPQALQQGLEGKLHVEFVILSDGKLAGARITRSSGYNILDKEALRALMAASPFPPIPPRMGKSRIDIVAGFEYEDNRLKYAPGP